MESIVGFDSAWSGRNKGAICALICDGHQVIEFLPPRQTTFDEAETFIASQCREGDFCLVAIDQPTIVPNLAGSRPVDRVAASLMGFIGGAAQRANRSKKGMFDDDAPIWGFKSRLGATERPEDSKVSAAGLFIIEVYPALALTAIHPGFCDRLCHPKYNPSKRNFQIAHWSGVIDAIALYADTVELTKVRDWARNLNKKMRPTKAEQDNLDSVLCALVAHHWRAKPRADSVLIGDMTAGYIVAPAHAKMRTRLQAAAIKYGVPFL